MRSSRSTVLALVLTTALAWSCSDRTASVESVPLETMRAAAEQSTDEMATFLATACTYASIESEGPELLPETEALLDFVLQTGRGMGFSARRAAGGLVGVLEYGSGREVVGAVVHLDVVPPGDLGEWEHPPFAGDIAGGKVFGRGAQDDKGALVGVLWGAKILIDNGMTFGRKLRIVLGTKEETSFEDVYRYIAEETPPDFGIVPDGPYVIRGESGYADLAYGFPGVATADDGSRDRVVYWQGGTAVNSVPDFSFAVLRSSDPPAARTEIEALIAQVTTEFTRGNKVPDLSVVDFATFAAGHDVSGVPPGDLVLSSHGQIAHSSVPSSGRNAIVEVALVGARMSHLQANAFRSAFAFVDQKMGLTTDGSGFGLSTDKPIPQAADTTASLDLAATDLAADRLDLTINFRVGVANTNDEVKQKSGAAAADYGATVRNVGTPFGAYYYPDDDPLLQLAIESYREVRGSNPPILAVGATTYVKAFPNMISYGPVDLAEDGLYFHTTDEQMPIASLTRNAVLFANMLQKLIQAPVAPRRG
jgi:succinyl-diaminopimelate desuccinylase